LNKGDWLALAKKAGAEKVFFVNDDPVLVFCEFQHIPNDAELLDTFRRIWCMARPQCLFIAMPDVLRVYRLNQPPAKNIRTLHEREIAVVEEVKEVAEKLRAYRREQVESGRLFAEKHFGGIDERADKRLIQDLKMVRKRLLDTKLNQKFVHALIGRSIFIRYLEDRNVLTSQYFQKIAKGNPKWEQCLAEELEKPDFMQGWE